MSCSTLARKPRSTPPPNTKIISGFKELRTFPRIMQFLANKSTRSRSGLSGQRLEFGSVCHVLGLTNSERSPGPGLFCSFQTTSTMCAEGGFCCWRTKALKPEVILWREGGLTPNSKIYSTFLPSCLEVREARIKEFGSLPFKHPFLHS